MQAHITPERIANAIIQDTSFKGVYVLVEGKKDLKMYGKFFSKTDARLRQTWGKYAQRKVWELLSERGFTQRIAIRDADFIRIPGNVKYDPGYSEAFFLTDHHDSEILAIEEEVIESILPVTHDQDALSKFEAANGPLRGVVKDLARPIGILRLASKREELGLVFKPSSADGDGFKHQKFVDLKELRIDVDKMINTLWEFSNNKSHTLKSRAQIKDAYTKYAAMNFVVEDLINGHDFTALISLVSIKRLNCRSKLFDDGDAVEEALAVGFTKAHFANTSLYSAIDAWQKTNCVNSAIL